MAEYNATRKRAGSFLNLAKSPALATEVTLQPVDRFPLDAAILFSDILTVPDAMGLGLYFAEGEGPKFERPVRTEADVGRLAVPDPELTLGYVMDAVREIRRALANRIPLIGFSGSPFTLACYMVEGGGSDDFRHVKTMLYARPDLLHRILAVNARAVADYLNAQIAAGAQAVMLFDTWGGALADGAYQEFSLRYLKEVDRAAADGTCRRACAEHRLHQRWRALARRNCRRRLRCGRPRLDRESRAREKTHRRSMRAAREPRPDGTVCAGSLPCVLKCAGSSTISGCRFAPTEDLVAMSSIWAMASRSSRLRMPLRSWSTRSRPTAARRAAEAPHARSKSSVWLDLFTKARSANIHAASGGIGVRGARFRSLSH